MSIGLLETPFLSITAMACDAALKSADVTLLGLEPIATEVILSRFTGDPGSVRAAFDAAEIRVKSLGLKVVSTTILNAPPPSLSAVLSGPNSINPLYGGWDYLLPTDHKNQLATVNPQAIGILETQGLAAVQAALDAGPEAIGDLGKLYAAQVIARPHEDLLKLLPV